MFGYLGPFQWRFSMGIACYLEKKYVFTYRKGKVQNWWHLPKNGQIQKPPMPKYANAFSVLIAHALQLILSAFNFTGCGKKSVLSRWSQIKSVNFNQTSHFLVHRSGTVQCVFPYFLAVLRTCCTLVLLNPYNVWSKGLRGHCFNAAKNVNFTFDTIFGSKQYNFEEERHSNVFLFLKVVTLWCLICYEEDCRLAKFRVLNQNIWVNHKV